MYVKHEIIIIQTFITKFIGLNKSLLAATKISIYVHFKYNGGGEIKMLFKICFTRAGNRCDDIMRVMTHRWTYISLSSTFHKKLKVYSFFLLNAFNDT